MRMMTWATAWTGTPEAPAERPFSRRSVPPHLLRAVDQERLHLTIQIKGLEPSRVVHFARALSTNAALREIDRLVPHPALWPRGRPAQRRMADMERWFCQDVAPTVLWRLNQPSTDRIDPSNQLICAPIGRGLDLVAGLTRKHPYLMGDTLTFADIAAASVLAPVAREQGWAWADTQGTIARVFHTNESWRERPGAAWVRAFYEQHGKAQKQIEEPQRAWLP
jgi:glutathione S-transferase